MTVHRWFAILDTALFLMALGAIVFGAIVYMGAAGCAATSADAGAAAHVEQASPKATGWLEAIAGLFVRNKPTTVSTTSGSVNVRQGTDWWVVAMLAGLALLPSPLSFLRRKKTEPPSTRVIIVSISPGREPAVIEAA